MTLTYSTDPRIALRNGYDRILATCNNWGNIGVTADPGNGSLQQTLGHAFAALAVASQSTAGLCILSGGIVSTSLGVCNPYTSSMIPPISVDNAGYTWGDTYLPMGVAGAEIFGPTMPVDPAGQARWETPVLILEALLRATATLPTARPPMFRNTTMIVIPAAPIPYPLRVWPVSGRSWARVSFRVHTPGAPATAAVSVTGLHPGSRYEISLAGPNNVIAEGQISYDIHLDNMAFILAKASIAAGAPEVYAELSAID